MKFKKYLSTIFTYLFLGLLLYFAIEIRNPLWASIRFLLKFGISFLSVLILISTLKFRKSMQKITLISGIICFTVLGILSYKEINFQIIKYRVMNSSQADLRKWGKYFIVGYRDFASIKTLVYRGAIAGIYITHRNVKNKSLEQIHDEIQILQQIQKKNGLPPLIIAADQEGGEISHLSPPLTQLPYLSASLINIEEYASIHGNELAQMGITMNFAPVVDLKVYPKINFVDLRSQIQKRAISANPKIVSETAMIYCRTLNRFGITPTLKHFPGLGKIAGDTHLRNVYLDEPLEILRKDDWLPYKDIIASENIAIMVSHVTLRAVDDQKPCSISKKVIKEILRGELNFHGILITDDFSMLPIANRSGGVRKAAVESVDAGINYILISYDTDLYFEAMDGLIDSQF